MGVSCSILLQVLSFCGGAQIVLGCSKLNHDLLRLRSKSAKSLFFLVCDSDPV